MTARDRLLRDAGVLTLATSLAAAGAGGALAMKRPAPHNFKPKMSRPLPHNFVKVREAS